MFTEQFVAFTTNVKRTILGLEDGEDYYMKKRFNNNLQFLQSGQKLRFPENYEQRFPFQLREIFDMLKKYLKREDLILLLNGKLFTERFVNVYFKILEKMNLVQLAKENYQR